MIRAGSAPRRVGGRIPAYALFIDPPLGRIGLTEREVRAAGIKALTTKYKMTAIGRARERGAPYTAISRAVYIHPTVAEYLPTMLGELTPPGRRFASAQTAW